MKLSRTVWMIAALSLLVFLVGGPVDGKTVYKWTDSKGEVHLTDYPPEQVGDQTPVEAIDVKEIERRIERVKEPALPPEAEAAFEELTRNLAAAFGSSGPVPGGEIPGAEKMQQQMAGWFASPEMGLFQLTSARMMTFVVAFGLFVHLLYSLSLYQICRKLGVPHAWLAWIPTVNFIPTVRAAGLSLWWSLPLLAPLLSYIPGVSTNVILVILLIAVLVFDIVFFFVLWIRICGNLWISKWWGLLILVAPLFLILLGYLAFKEEPEERSVSRLRPAMATLVFFVVLTASSYVGLKKVVMPRMMNEMEQPMSTMSQSFFPSEDALKLLSNPEGPQN
jgi:hypothetical protein